jgi:hypothetical protein
LNKASLYWRLNDHFLPIFRLALWACKETLKRIGLRPKNDFAARPFRARKFNLRERCDHLNTLGLSVIETTYFSPMLFPPYLDKLLPKQAIWTAKKFEDAATPHGLSRFGQAFVVFAHKGNDNHEAAVAP